MRTARSGNYVVCISTMRHNSRSYFTPEIGISHFCTTTSLQFHHFCTVVYQPRLWGVSSTPFQFHFLVPPWSTPFWALHGMVGWTSFSILHISYQYNWCRSNNLEQFHQSHKPMFFLWIPVLAMILLTSWDCLQFWLNVQFPNWKDQ